MECLYSVLCAFTWVVSELQQLFSIEFYCMTSYGCHCQLWLESTISLKTNHNNTLLLMPCSLYCLIPTASTQLCAHRKVLADAVILLPSIRHPGISRITKRLKEIKPSSSLNSHPHILPVGPIASVAPSPPHGEPALSIPSHTLSYLQ